VFINLVYMGLPKVVRAVAAADHFAGVAKSFAADGNAGKVCVCVACLLILSIIPIKCVCVCARARVCACVCLCMCVAVCVFLCRAATL